MGNTSTTGSENDETTDTETDSTSTETETDSTETETGSTDTETDSTETAGTHTDTGDDFEAKYTAARKHSATWEKRAKDNKTALDAALAENATLKQQVEGFENGQTLATQAAAIAEAHGVPVTALRGDSADELTEHAKLLQQFFPRSPDGKGMGNAGGSLHGDDDRSAKDIVDAATGH